ECRGHRCCAPPSGSWRNREPRRAATTGEGEGERGSGSGKEVRFRAGMRNARNCACLSPSPPLPLSASASFPINGYIAYHCLPVLVAFGQNLFQPGGVIVGQRRIVFG